MVRRSGLSIVLGAAALHFTTPARAQTLPWQSGVPLPEAARSVQILKRDQPLKMGPSRNAKARGSARLGARLPLFGATRGPGCSGKWLNVGSLAWVCETDVRLISSPPVRVRRTPRWVHNGLPLDYHFAGQDGSLGYARLSLGDVGVPDYTYDPGFAVAILQTKNNVVGESYGLTTKGLWVPMRDFRPARAFLFKGAELSEGRLNVGFIHVDSARARRSPGGSELPGTLTKFERVTVFEEKKKGSRSWFRIGEKRWLNDKQVRVPRPSDGTPAGLREGERWIDVDIERQTVTAYEGKRAVFATISSTGRGRGRSEMATPRGDFRVWVKLETTDMDNLENEYAGRYYAIQEVPWVMYFKKGYGLHGTFWHRRFGNRKSHGCVNLSPLDAQRLFHWSQPSIPAGWSAALPTPYDRGTLVHVR